jgi:hypothetical protein
VNGNVRIVNLRLDQILIGCGTSHIGVNDTASIAREKYITHVLHLNSRGKKKLKLLVDKRIDYDHLSSSSSIPVITHARTSHFLA